ncbi:hypothetical protein OWR29_26525 [Actinoplanes sp. Pm04-4]|uniref:Cytochrome c domain-containing protein n=1 Tax=Paractinoplanes pyxinae TaxID=2997416 RepID=A0ABT4B504_9ACTN|nr:hypothetical protein [Actinoplanes pyxinae]MCY1141569.1 hypothetical protein [Actinoplanes pyxinae]
MTRWKVCHALPTLRQWADAQTGEQHAVLRQRNYLRNPLPAGEGICVVCHSSAGEGFARCYQCEQHRMAGGDGLADVVAPIAYAVKGDQHAHALAVYKANRPSALAKRNLSSLAILFIAYHWECLARAVGGDFTHIASVPSTRGRPGSHPVDDVVTRRISIPAVSVKANAVYQSDDRRFHPDRFVVDAGIDGARVLLVDDTWTTGSRIQSLALALKRAGAAAVAIVVLGRHVNPGYGPSKALVARLRQEPDFDLRKCVLESEPVS